MAFPFRIALCLGTSFQYYSKCIICMKKLKYQEWSNYWISRKASLFLPKSKGFLRFNLSGMRAASSACSLSSANVRSNFLCERLYRSSMLLHRAVHSFSNYFEFLMAQCWKVWHTCTKKNTRKQTVSELEAIEKFLSSKSNSYIKGRQHIAYMKMIENLWTAL